VIPKRGRQSATLVVARRGSFRSIQLLEIPKDLEVPPTRDGESANNYRTKATQRETRFISTIGGCTGE
jgi:hypothetical protein